MALRKCTENVINQENLTSRLGEKAAIILPAKGLLPKRPAFCELGNKLPNLNSNNGAVKKLTDNIKPPPPLPKGAGAKKEKENTHVEAKRSNTHQSYKEISKVNESIETVSKRKDEKIVEVPKSYSTSQLSLLDPDESTKNEPQMVTEYLSDIFSYLRELECKFPIREKYMEGHQSTPRMRSILINWLVEVHMNFKFYQETLHLCVAIVDRYLQGNKNIGREALQLVGTSSMLIAGKYEEIYLPDLEDLVYICDDTFSTTQILKMEVEILKKLDFSLGRPLSIHFLRRYNKIARVRNDHHTLGKYMLELALVDYDMCHIKPSLQAAAACCLSIAVLNEVMDPSRVWTPTLATYSTYEYSDFKSVLVNMAHLVVKSETSKYQAVRKKYSVATYGKISLNRKLHGPLIWKLTSTSTTSTKKAKGCI